MTATKIKNYITEEKIIQKINSLTDDQVKILQENDEKYASELMPLTQFEIDMDTMLFLVRLYRVHILNGETHDESVRKSIASVTSPVTPSYNPLDVIAEYKNVYPELV